MSINALPTAPLSMAQIQAEFDEDGFDSTTQSLSYYYRLTLSIPGQGDLIVPPFANKDGTYGTIPTSGEISIGQFRGASQGIGFATTFLLYTLGSDPYYLGSAVLPDNFANSGVNIGAGLFVKYGGSSQDAQDGSLNSVLYFTGDVTGSTATIFNHTNGRSRSMSSAVQKQYVGGSNYTLVVWNDGSPGGAYNFAGWPNDGITLYTLFGSPTTWNNYDGTVPNQPETTTRYTSFLRAF
jgi:hypothetical protein